MHAAFGPPAAARTVSTGSLPCPRAVTLPSASTATTRTVAPARSTPSAVIDVPFAFASFERQRRRAVGAEDLPVGVGEQTSQPPLVGHGEDDDARSFPGRKAPIVEVV